MVINLLYMFVIGVAIYFGIRAYICTKKKMLLGALGILVISLLLEFQWMNLGNFQTDITDISWTARDIMRTIVTVYLFNFAYPCEEKKITKKNKSPKRK